jgi:hypothetical protein
MRWQLHSTEARQSATAHMPCKLLLAIWYRTIKKTFCWVVCLFPELLVPKARRLLTMSSKKSNAPVNKILSYVRPFQPILPEIEEPKAKVELKLRLMWTLGVLFIYLVCCQVGHLAAC